jgi:predicted nucleic acid-binding protein
VGEYKIHPTTNCRQKRVEEIMWKKIVSVLLVEVKVLRKITGCWIYCCLSFI